VADAYAWLSFFDEHLASKQTAKGALVIVPTYAAFDACMGKEQNTH